MLNAADFWYFQIVISKPTRYDVNHRNSVTAPSFTAKACTEIRVTTEDNSNVLIGRSMEWSSDLRSDIIVKTQEYFHEVDLSVNCTNTNHAGAPLQNWTNRYTVIYLNGYGWDVSFHGMNSEGLTVGALYLPDFTKYQIHI